MAQFLSETWIKEIAEALASSDEIAAVTEGEDFILQQVVSGGPEGDVPYYVAIDDGRIEVARGHHDAPTVTVSSAYDIAAAVNRGDKSPPAVLMSGKAKVDGNLKTLMAKQKLLGAVGGVIGTVPTKY